MTHLFEEEGFRRREQEETAPTETFAQLALAEVQGTPERRSPEVLRQMFQSAQDLGVQLRFKEGRAQFSLVVAGKEQVLANVEVSQEGAEAAKSTLEKLAKEKQTDLSQRFGVNFAQNGEDVERKLIPKDDIGINFDKGEMIKARQLRLDQLSGIEAALQRSTPSQLTADGKQSIKFYFLNEPLVEGPSRGTIATFIEKDKDGGPAVYFWPEQQGAPITEKDLGEWNIHAGYSVESLLVHEFAHNTQNKLGWRNPAKVVDFSKEIGWTPFEDKASGQLMVVLEGKDGKYYDYKPTEDYWFLCTSDGQPLDKDGKVVADAANAQRFTSEQIRDLARVKPATLYMDNPVEIQAEGMMLLRLSQKHREYLFKESPALYSHVKRQDQEEINMHFGVKPDGTPNRIRALDGTLVENTEANRREIAVLENNSAERK